MILLSLLAACLIAYLPEPDDVMVAAAAAQFPDATVATLAEGRALVLDRCSGCHAAPGPADVRDPDWPEVFPAMVEEAELTATEAERVRAYLVVSAATAR